MEIQRSSRIRCQRATSKAMSSPLRKSRNILFSWRLLGKRVLRSSLCANTECPSYSITLTQVINRGVVIHFDFQFINRFNKINSCALFLFFSFLLFIFEWTGRARVQEHQHQRLERRIFARQKEEKKRKETARYSETKHEGIEWNIDTPEKKKKKIKTKENQANNEKTELRVY